MKTCCEEPASLELPINLSLSFPEVGISSFLSGRVLETPQRHMQEDTVMKFKYECKDYLVFIYYSYFSSCSGEIQYLLFLASFALHRILPLLLLLSFSVPIALAKGV